VILSRALFTDSLRLAELADADDRVPLVLRGLRDWDGIFAEAETRVARLGDPIGRVEGRHTDLSRNERRLMDLPLRWTVSGISLAIFTLAVAGLLALGAGQASASHVSCGDEITADTTLDSDLVD
jgi:hypothetical protein